MYNNNIDILRIVSYTCVMYYAKPIGMVMIKYNGILEYSDLFFNKKKFINPIT